MNKLLVAVATTLLVVSVTAAQVARTQSGRALDANYQIGGGGVNPVSAGARINSQLYVTGQVTGLGGFRGNVGYYAANTMRLTLPSAAMETFQGQSVGLAQAVGGVAYKIAPYYQRSQTVMGTNAIVAGRTMTGTNAPRAGSGSWPVGMSKLLAEATKGYTGLMRVRPQGVLDIAPPPPGGRGVSVATGPMGTMDRFRTIRPARLADTAGLLKEQDSRRLATELYEMYRVDGTVPAEVDADLRAAPRSIADKSVPPLRSDQASGSSGWTRGRLAGGKPVPDQDVFLDLLMRLRELRDRRVHPGVPVPSSPDDGADEILVRVETNSVVLRALAGRSRDRFNRFMAKGGELLRNGKYYDAVRQYGYAEIINSSNPMAQLGLAVAYFAAGESLTASLQLRKAFRLFPPLMQTRLDVRRLIGDVVLARRLAGVDRQLSRRSLRDERSLVFLATFMHYCAGHVAETRRSAQMLRKLAKADDLLRTYADYILTGKLPGKAPTSRPAKAGGQLPATIAD